MRYGRKTRAEFFVRGKSAWLTQVIIRDNFQKINACSIGLDARAQFGTIARAGSKCGYGGENSAYRQ
jgi:hypothetical protein